MVDMANHDFLNIFDYRSATFFPYVRVQLYMMHTHCGGFMLLWT